MDNRSFPVLFLSQAFPDTPDSYRGIFIKNLARSVVLEKRPVVVVTPRIGSAPPKHEITDGIEVFRFFFPSDRPLITYKRIPVFRMLVYMVSCLFQSFSIVKRRRCRLIHVHWIHPNGIIGVILSVFFRVPLIVHVRGSDFHSFGKRNLFFTWLTRLVLARSDWILCTSEELKRGILEAFPELEIKNISVAYNEVDTSLFKPIPEKEARNYLGIQEEGLHFLFVGNLVREKGVMDLIEVLIEMLEEGMEDRFFVHLVGTGPLYGNLKGLVHSRGLEGKIYVHGLVSPRQIPFWMNASNLLILPSEREGMPNVVMEAVYCGIPVLATNVGDIHVFIRNKENGYLISPENKKGELSIILKEIFSNPEQVVVMKSRLQKKILEKQNNKIPFLGDVTDIYKMLLRNRNVSLNHV